MSYANISKAFTFSAAHRLPNHDGLCRNQHGHNYRLVVHATGAVNHVKYGQPQSTEGMVMDYKELSRIVKEDILPELDHQDLNVTLVASGKIPVSTAELIATYILRKLRTISTAFNYVELSETPDTNCVVSEGDL